jgi:rfaE bifunctional protein kinase chain/domain
LKGRKLDPYKLVEIVDSFNKARIAVIGDIIADKYIFSFAHRVSREAPVLILKYEGEEIKLGGAGNAINNVKALGAEVIPFGFVGKDSEGKAIKELMKKLNIDISGVLELSYRKTITKTRILAGSHHTVKQQVLRIDSEPEEEVKDEDILRLIEWLDRKVDLFDAVIISDYGYGTVNDTVRNYLQKLKEKIICVDSRYDLLKYKNVTACTPNEPETMEALGLKKLDNGNILEAGKRLLELTGNQAVLITRGKKGMALFTREGEIEFIDIYGTDQVADVTGAGDTVIAIFTTALAVGATFFEAAKLANYGGGISVTKMGAAIVSPIELKGAIENDLLKRKDKDL